MSNNMQIQTTFYEQELHGDIANRIETIIISSVLISPQTQATNFLLKVPKYWLTEEYYPYYEAIQKLMRINSLMVLILFHYSLMNTDNKNNVMLMLANKHIITNIDDYLSFLEQKYILRQQYELGKKLYYATNEYKVINIEQEIHNHKLLNREQYSIKTFAEWDKFYKENSINIQKYELGIPF